jgi:DNA-binding protein Fis
MFKKGQSGNPSGRKKGSKNKKTQEWNRVKEYIRDEGAYKFITELKKLNGKDYVKSYAMILEYIEPKLARTEATVDAKIEGDQNLTISFVEPSKPT